MERVVCIVIGYLFGLIQTSYFIGKIKGLDIRDYGSGNAGTTNAMRVFGRKLGFVTVAVDIFKCIAAVLVTWAIYHGHDAALMLRIYTAAGVVIGHDYPFFMKFHGGKGIAATAGMIIAFGDWRLILLGVICFFVPARLTHHISVGSLCLSSCFLIGLIVLGQAGSYGMAQPRLTEMYIVVAVLTALAFFQHRGNIRRLAEGTERRVWDHKKN